MTEKIIVHVDPEIKGLVGSYLGNRKKDIAMIKQYIEYGRFEDIRMAGHKMKGGGELYGFKEITRLGRLIEQGAENKDMKMIRGALSLLEDYMNRIEVN